MDDDFERLKQMDAYERAAFVAELRERNERQTEELRADTARRRAAEPLHYRERRQPEPVATNSRDETLTEYEIARLKAAASIDWRAEIAAALEARSLAQADAYADFILTSLREQREAIEAAFNAKLLELRCDLVERMLGTLETLRKVADREPVDLPAWPSKRGDAKPLKPVN